MLATALTAALDGVDAVVVRVEADTTAGFPRFSILGLADSCVRESEGRIRAALRNCGYAFKWDRRITVNLAPAHLRKIGSRIGVVGKYIGLQDAYKSVYEAVIPGGIGNDCGVEVQKVDAEEIENGKGRRRS